MRSLILTLVVLGHSGVGFAQSATLELADLTVTPHVQSTGLRYRREPDFSLGARAELFLRNGGEQELRLSPDAPIRLRGKSPEELLAAGEWTWHDFPSAWTNQPLVLPPGALTVWTFNGKRAPWGVGTSATLAVPGAELKFDLAAPRVWLSAVTFLGDPTNPVPDSLVFHVVNRTAGPLRVEACRLWLPASNVSWRALRPQPWFTNLNRFPADAVIPAGDRGGARIQTGPLPLTYTAVEVRLRDQASEPHEFKPEPMECSGHYCPHRRSAGRRQEGWTPEKRLTRRPAFKAAGKPPLRQAAGHAQILDAPGGRWIRKGRCRSLTAGRKASCREAPVRPEKCPA